MYYQRVMLGGTEATRKHKDQNEDGLDNIKDTGIVLHCVRNKAQKRQGQHNNKLHTLSPLDGHDDLHDYGVQQ